MQSATRQEGKQSMVLVRKVCYHIYYDLEKKEKHYKKLSDGYNTLRVSFVRKQSPCMLVFPLHDMFLSIGTVL